MALKKSFFHSCVYSENNLIECCHFKFFLLYYLIREITFKAAKYDYIIQKINCFERDFSFLVS